MPRQFTTEDGLPHDVCYNLTQDSKGNIWIGTDDGLARFNGDGFDVFNQEHGLTNSFVIDVKEHLDDTLLLATWGGGLNYYLDGKIRLYPNSVTTAKYNITQNNKKAIVCQSGDQLTFQNFQDIYKPIYNQYLIF